MIVRFETTYEDGYWSASAIGYSIFTDGETFEELLKNIEEAVLLYFEDEVEPNEQITIQTQITHQVHHVATSSSCWQHRYHQSSQKAWIFFCPPARKSQ